MALKRGTGFPSDSIRFRTGFDGFEHPTVLKTIGQLTQSDEHVALVINTSYSEVAGGYYLNRSLFRLVQGVLETLGIHIVAWEYYRKDDIVPVEDACGLEDDEKYCLVTTDLVIQGLLVLNSTWVNCGQFYGENNQRLHFVMPRAVVPQFHRSLASECQKVGVRFNEYPPESPSPVILRATFLGLLRRLILP